MDALAPDIWHPGADSGCAVCGGSGFEAVPESPTLQLRRCGCVGRCPRCGGGGMLKGGLESCACRDALERVAGLSGVGLPWPSATEEPPAVLADWLAGYRPEPGWPWLTAHARHEGSVVRGLIRLVTSIGAPLHLVRSEADLEGRRHWRRLVACLGLQDLGPRVAEALTSEVAERELTLVATADLLPFPDEGPGLEAQVGDATALALIEHGSVVP